MRARPELSELPSELSTVTEYVDNTPSSSVAQELIHLREKVFNLSATVHTLEGASKIHQRLNGELREELADLEQARIRDERERSAR